MDECLPPREQVDINDHTPPSLGPAWSRSFAKKSSTGNSTRNWQLTSNWQPRIIFGRGRPCRKLAVWPCSNSEGLSFPSKCTGKHGDCPGWTVSSKIYATPFAPCGEAPGFTLAAIAMLALGIGVNAAVFTVTNAVLFKGFSYIDRQRPHPNT